MKKINNFLNDYRVIIYIIGVVSFMLLFFKLPNRVDDLEAKDIVHEEVMDDTETAVEKLAANIDKYVAVAKEQKEGSDKREELLIEWIREQKKINGD